MHYLNTRQYKKEITQFLANGQKFHKIKNQPDEVFIQFKDYQLWEMIPKSFFTEKELKKNVNVKNIFF